MSISAFTLIELLVVICVVMLLLVIGLVATFRDSERVLRAQCLNNLREIGVGLSVYAVEEADYVPVCGWPSGQNPWQTYSAARVVTGTTNLTRGYMSLGLLFRTRIVSDPSAFYCPGLARNANVYTYDYYTTASNWPSTPAGTGDDQIRTAYNYYPQLRVTAQALPKLVYTATTLEVGGTFNMISPKLTDLNPNKSIATDMVHNSGITSHKAYGAIGGVNALFPNGSAVFQNPHNLPEAFDPALWGSPSSPDNIGNNQLNFRYVMSLWQP